MSTETRPGIFVSMINAYRNLGNQDIIEYEETSIVDPILISVLDKIKSGKLIKDAEDAINTTGGSKKGKNGIRKKYEAPTIEVEEMSPEKLEKMIKTLNGADKERDNY